MLFIPSGSAVFREELPHGMNGTKLQFGHYESSNGDASFADRGWGSIQAIHSLRSHYDLPKEWISPRIELEWS